MAGSNVSLQQNPTMSSLFASLDPRSLILSQFSSFHQPQTLQLTTDSFFMERGPRYDDYAALRDSKLRMKQQQVLLTEEDEFKVTVTPPKKQVRFQGNLATPPKRTKGSSILTQSVPDFSSALRKENRKPTTTLPPTAEKSMLPPLAEKSLTPPLKSKSGRFEAIMGRLGGSKSVNSGEKKGGGFMARKSYASLDELRSFTSDARIAINGENRPGRTTSTRGGVGKTVLGYRQY